MAQHVAPAPAPHLGSSHAHNELQPTFHNRVTKDGRRLWYKLTVIQQPERARACGSGPKSSADRRPVDPPPVVELRIFEGNTWDEAEQKDITFLYNANFFLYATLEHARVMAHGRVQTPAANQPPVLTGMPVSGMAYLDRPNEAGYFLFPDLSVRHEGRYRLTFNLYEETKEEKDKEPDTSAPSTISQGFPNATGGSFDFRMEVKSQDFIVFSAKKFPGLTESTALSRVVAEQGCRVRIRRDVRMRRRDGGKSGGGDYDNNAEDEYARRKRTETPEVKQSFRPRSTSGSVERGSLSAESQRRPSGAEYPPPFPQTPVSAGGHLQFLGSSAQYPPHSQSISKPPSVPPSPSYQTSHRGQFPSVHQPSPSHHMSVRPEEESRFAYDGRLAKMHADAHPLQQQSPHTASYPAPQQQQAYGQSDRPQLPTYAQRNSSPLRETASRDPRESSQREPREPYRQSSKDFSLPAPPYPQRDTESTAVTLPPITNLMRRSQMSPTATTAGRGSQMYAMQPPKPSVTLPPLPPPSVAGAKRGREEPMFEPPRYQNRAREDPQLAEQHEDPPMVYHRANGNIIRLPNEYV